MLSSSLCRHHRFKVQTFPNLLFQKVKANQRCPQDLAGGGKKYFCSDLKICMSQSDKLRMANPCSLLGGFGSMPPPPEKIFLNGTIWCVRFDAYLDQILFFKNFKNYHFLYKNFKKYVLFFIQFF